MPCLHLLLWLALQLAEVKSHGKKLRHALCVFFFFTLEGRRLMLHKGLGSIQAHLTRSFSRSRADATAIVAVLNLQTAP